MTAIKERDAERAEPLPGPSSPTRRRLELHRLLARRASRRGPRRPAGAATVITAWALGTLSVLTLWVLFFALVLSSLQEAHGQHDLYAKFREQLSKQTAPLGGVIRPGSPVALISAPKLGLKDVVVAEGTDSGDLEKGPGHRRDTVLPGQKGASVIYGRATLFGGPFGSIANAHPGDEITVTTGQGRFRFVVQDVRHVGDPFPLPAPTDGGALTLVTSEGASIGNLWRPQHPLYVDAVLVSKAKPAPTGHLSAVPKSEQAMHGDVGSLMPLVLWIPLLLILILATVWAALRWGAWQAWLVGAPLVAAGLWGISETAVQLLPNLT